MVLITRPLSQSLELLDLMKQNNIDSTIFPTLEIKKNTYQNSTQYEVIIFISKNAVEFGANFLLGQNNYLLLAVGASTATKLVELGFRVDAYPQDTPSSESLLNLDIVKNLTNKRILIVRGVGGMETLKQQLQQNNNIVDYLEVYQRVPTKDIKIYINNLEQFILSDNKIIIVTSIDIFDALISLTKDIYLINHDTKFVVTSPRVKKYLQQQGFFNIIVAGVNNNQILSGVNHWLN